MAAAGVEAFQVAQVQDFVLRRMPDDGDLAGAVRRRRNVVPQRKPAERVQRLTVQRDVRLVVGVDEEVPLRLEVRAA